MVVSHKFRCILFSFLFCSIYILISLWLLVLPKSYLQCGIISKYLGEFSRYLSITNFQVLFPMFSCGSMRLGSSEGQTGVRKKVKKIPGNSSSFFGQWEPILKYFCPERWMFTQAFRCLCHHCHSRKIPQLASPTGRAERKKRKKRLKEVGISLHTVWHGRAFFPGFTDKGNVLFLRIFAL